jgi:hypothetical protein
MFLWKSASVVTLVILTVTFLAAENSVKEVHRDSDAIEVLARTLAAAGGLQAVSAVRDLTESGEITFHWGEGHKGPVTLQGLTGNHFRMEADLPEGKRIWVVKSGVGSLKEPKGRVHAISGDNAINLENLTFPIAHIVAALTDSTANVLLVGIEKQADRSVYRLRVKGHLGLTEIGKSPGLLVEKDLLIDALTFSIVSVGDRPFRTYDAGHKPSDKPSREINFGDFRAVRGIQVPFSITTKLMGQETLTITFVERRI